MQGQQKPSDGIFYPEDLKDLEAELKAESRPGESNLEREDRAIRLLQRERKRPHDLPDDLK